MLTDKKKTRTPITYESANGLLRPEFDQYHHKVHMAILLCTFGDGEWWTSLLHDALSGWMLTEDFQTMSRPERLRRSDAIKHLSTYLRECSGGAQATRRPSATSRLRLARAVMGEPLWQEALGLMERLSAR